MAYSNQNSGSFGLKFKRCGYYGNQATMWCKETKKPGVYKYTMVKGKTTFTFLVDPGANPFTNDKGVIYFPIKVIQGNASETTQIF